MELSSPTRAEAPANQFDRMVIDVDELYARYPLGTRPSGIRERKSPFAALHRTPLLPLRVRGALSRLLRRTHVDVGWFYLFVEYWTNVLGGRWLVTVDDFSFLKNVYRARFQQGEVPNTNDAFVHLEAWQRPEVVYQLFYLAEKEALFDQAEVVRRAFRYVRPRVVLEYGCGTAPIVTSLRQFGYSSIRALIADIKTIAFHYAGFKFASDRLVEPILLEAENAFSVPSTEKVDMIFCTAVFEHLNRPMDTARALHAALRPGGLLVFDYLAGEGTGFDTIQGVEERRQVLEFIGEQFEICEGSLDIEGSTALTFARKRR